LRTTLAIRVAGSLGRLVYVGAGRHARLSLGPPQGLIYEPAPSFYDELLSMIVAWGRLRGGEAGGVILDEFFANLVPLRSLMYESYIMRMVLAEVAVMRRILEDNGTLLIVCAERGQSQEPVGIRYLRALNPVVLRTSLSNSTLEIEQRDLAEPRRRLELVAALQASDLLG